MRLMFCAALIAVFSFAVSPSAQAESTIFYTTPEASCQDEGSCAYQNGLTCNAGVVGCHQVGKCAECNCGNDGCSCGCVTQHTQSDPDYVDLDDDPIEDYEVEDLNLDGLMARARVAGWTPSSTATEPDPITERYSGEKSFKELIEAMAEDFGICVAFNETLRTVAFSDCL